MFWCVVFVQKNLTASIITQAASLENWVTLYSVVQRAASVYEGMPEKHINYDLIINESLITGGGSVQILYFAKSSNTTL